MKVTPAPIRRLSLALCILASALGADAGEILTIPEIGPHQPILTVEKNVNPQNVMVVYTKVDAAGHFLSDPVDPNRPSLDFYWLMDRKTYKPVNALIKAEIRKRFDAHWAAGDRATHFVVDVNDLKEMKSDIKVLKMDISMRGSGDTRSVEAQMNLGPSNDNARIKLTSIYTEGRAFPPSVQSVTLNGEEVVNGSLTGKKMTRKYAAGDESNQFPPPRS